MSDQPIRVLLIEDNPGDVRLIRELLAEAGAARFEVTSAECLSAGLERLAEGGADVLLLDLMLPDSQGLDTFVQVHSRAPGVPIIVLTGFDDEARALQAVRDGAQDFLVKGRVAGTALARAMEYALERKRIEEQLRQSERRLKEAQHLGRMGNWEFDLETQQIRWSDMVFALYERDPALGPPTAEEEAAYYSPEDAQRLRAAARRTVETGDPYEIDIRLRLPGGRHGDVIASGAAVKDRDGAVVGLAGTVHDITKRKEAERRERLARDVLELLNTPTADTDPVRDILRLVQASVGFDAVGIRLRAPDGDFPYYETRGFGEDFVEAERYLCSHDQAGNVLRDELGNPVLECMCGNVLCGRTDPSQPFFTEAGSFWTNSTTRLLATTTERERQGRTRNRCNSAGYESMTLIPLRSDSEVIGLLQLNDRRPDRLTREAIQFLEGLGASIGIALSRKRAEQRLLTLRKAADSSGEVIFMTDHDGIITDVNPEFTRVYGYTAAEVVGKTTPRVLKSGTTAPEVYEGFWRTLLNKQVVKGELVNKTKDGRLVPIEGSANPILDEQGNVVGFLAVQRDITERKQAEEALRRSEEGYRSLVEGMPHGVYRSTVDGRFLSCNPAFVAMLGYASEAELLRVDIATEVYQDPTQRARLIEERRERDVIEPLEVGWKRKDGTPITVRLSGRTVREPGGATLCFEMSAEDVTEHRALEGQLRQAQKMEAVGQFAGGIAHDFNNLLATVLTTAELMSDACPEGSELGEDIRTIQHAALSGAELTRRLLAFGRRQPLELRPVDLTDVVRGFAKAARRLVREDIEIGMVLDQPAAMVRADPGALEQILMNLVTNARDAIPESGSLVIQTGRATLDQEFCDTQGWGIPGEYVTLTVTDTGIGMDDETRRRVFEPFFTTKAVGVGTGLGMAVVYGLAKEHRGYVQISSEVGHGTMVRVYLPAVLGGAAGLVSPATIVPVRGGTETILLVEDAESLRRAGTRVLVKNGYTVLSAADGIEALDLFHAHEKDIALVVTDVVMPRLGGPRLWAELKRQGKSVKFLFTSGYAARDVEEAKSLEPGIPFLSKPWSAPDLLRRVREVLDAPVVA